MISHCRDKRGNKIPLITWAMILGILGSQVPSRAADLYWSGTGTWNATTQNWGTAPNGPYNQATWNNSPADDAFFEGTAGPVTLGEAITAGSITLGVPGYTIAKGSHSLTATSLAGTGNVTFTGTGQLSITGSSSGYSGTVTLGPGSNAGSTDIVVVGSGDSLGTGTINMRGAQLSAGTASIIVSNAVDVAAGGFRVGGSNSFTLAGPISVDNFSRTFANYGDATVTLGDIVTAGASTVVAFDNAQLGTPGGLIVVSGVISGSGQISSSNANANTRLAGANAFTGQSSISAGMLVLANTLALQNSTVNYTDGSLVFSDAVAGNAFTFGGLSGSAALTLANNAGTPTGVTVTVGGNNATTSFTGNLTGAGSLTKAGSGTLTLGGGTVAPASGITVTGGRLTLSRAGQIDLSSTNITLGTDRELLVAYGTGTLGGSITMGAGSLLSLQNGNPEGNAAQRSTFNTNITLDSGVGAANAASIGGFVFGNSTVLTGTISGSGDLRWRNSILGGGTNSATITAANNTSGWAVNSYTGATSFEGVNLTFSLASNVDNGVVRPFGVSNNAVSITGGQLRFLQTAAANNTTIIENNLSLSAAAAATTTFFREDGNLRLTGTVDITTIGTGNVRLQSQWGAANSKGLTLAGALTGSGNLTITRSGGEQGSVRLSNSSNTFDGTITVNAAGGGAGILVLEADAAAAAAKINLAASGAHLNVSTVNATIAELSGVTGSGVSARSAGQTLTISQATNTTFAGTLGSTGITGADAALNVTKAGPGTLALTAANTHTGTTTVSGGTLLVNGSLASGSAVTVQAAGTLGGSGTIGGATTIFGTHSPGTSPGVQTFGGNLTYTGATVIWELTGNTATQTTPTAVFDQVIVGGNLDFTSATSLSLVFDDPASSVNWTNPFWDLDREWLLYDVTGTTSNFSNLSISTQSWLDGFGNVFTTERPQASFGLRQGDGSGDVFLTYVAVPEPGTLALAAAGLALAGRQLSRRRMS
jgi:fibronectin-binding autotransporter adhesin